MSQFPKPMAEIAPKDDALYKDSKVALLDKTQWSYVQRRYELTPRERQIAELICQGLRNGHIAKYLRIKPGTAKTHTRNIYRKVRVKSKISMLLRFVNDARELSTEYNLPPSVPITD